MSQVWKSLFSTTAQLNAAERIAQTYKTKWISFLDKSHQNPADWQRMKTYVDFKKSEMDELGLVEAMARGHFHPPHLGDSPDAEDHLTLHLINDLGIPIKSVHLNEDGTEMSIVDVPEKDRAKLAARIAASRAAAARAAAAATAEAKAGTKGAST